MGRLRHILELNALVLCGTTRPGAEAYAGHLAATERRFYEQRDGGIQDVVEWLATHWGETPSERAAGVYARVPATPSSSSRAITGPAPC